jgi:tetratricopeptide (TPR) repeat protein/transglutaminase-like putative cysteine protease
MAKFWTAAVALLAATGASLADDTPSPGSQTITTAIVVEADGHYVETIHTERFANNEAGAMSAGRVSIPYNAQLQELSIVEAYTQKPDGVRIPLDPTSVQEQMQRDSGPFSPYADLRTRVLEFPQYMAGDTIVYTVRLETKPYFPGRFTHRELYLHGAVAQNETTTISVPKAMTLKVDVRDVETTTRDDGGRRIYSFHYAPKPASSSPSALASLVIGSFSASAFDMVPHYAVSSFADYAELGRAEAALIEPKLVPDDKVTALAARIIGSETNRHEQAKKLYEWVVKNVRYVAIELGRGSLEPHAADWVIANGYGDCKDHDLLLRALLKASGIDSQSVLLNGTYIYTLSPAPGLSEINHVITYVPELDSYLDSSNAMAPFGVLSTNLYGKPAIRLSSKGASQVTLPPAPVSEVHTEVSETLANDGTLSGTLKTTVSGPASLTSRGTSLRLQTLSSGDTVTTRLAGHGLKDPKGTSQSDPPTDLAANHGFSVNFTSPGWSEWLAGHVQKQMPGATTALSGEAAAGAAMLSGKGDEAVACAGVHAVEHVTLTLPDSYTKIPHLPTDTTVDSGNLSFTAHWTFNGRQLSLERTLTTHYPQARCSGAVRNETAAALTRVRASYGTQISLNPEIAPKTDSTADVAAIRTADEAYKKGDFATVIRLITDLLGHSLNEQQAYAAHMVRGTTYMRQGQLNAAIADFTSAIAIKPDGDIAAYDMRARAYLRTARPKLALADYDVVIKRSPEDVILREAHADAATAAGDFASAVQDYDTILKVKPNTQRVLLMRATAQMGARHYDEAAADYEAAGKLNGSEIIILNGTCDALARSSRLGEALYQCARALEISPLSGAQLESRGLVYFRQGKFTKAQEDFNKAAETYPQNVRYLYERGLTRLKLDEKESGRRDIARATATDPDVVAKLPEAMHP